MQRLNNRDAEHKGNTTPSVTHQCHSIEYSIVMKKKRVRLNHLYQKNEKRKESDYITCIRNSVKSEGNNSTG